jgi:hypothetical protein
VMRWLRSSSFEKLDLLFSCASQIHLTLNMEAAVRDSIQTIDAQTWIVGDRLLLTRETGYSPGNIPSDKEDTSYAFREVSTPPQPQEPAAKVPSPLVYDLGDIYAVWQIGNSFLKIVVPVSVHTTREHVTLANVRGMDLDMGVSISEVLFHRGWGGRYYMIVTKMLGETLDSLWLRPDEQRRR